MTDTEQYHPPSLQPASQALPLRSPDNDTHRLKMSDGVCQPSENAFDCSPSLSASGVRAALQTVQHDLRKGTPQAARNRCGMPCIAASASLVNSGCYKK